MFNSHETLSSCPLVHRGCPSTPAFGAGGRGDPQGRGEIRCGTGRRIRLRRSRPLREYRRVQGQAGYAFFVKDERLHFIHNYVGLEKFEVVSSKTVPTGEVSLRYEFEPTGEPKFREGKGAPGRCQLYINEELVGNLEIPYSTPNLFGVLGASCGYAAFDSVNPAVYEAPFHFSGEIKQVVIDVSGEVIKDDEAELKRLMTQQ